ncbi:AAA family ATPase [Listeria monocytogenes]|uniref:AAA family ATPase n=1 Tax=Bacilli TaxID=91061 RepID=UPI000DFE04C3|nr:AAA family ATPase [Enterococcus faecalis]RBR38626.1 hypothetical protein EA75_01923 [Enterococcus faecalis]
MGYTLFLHNDMQSKFNIWSTSTDPQHVNVVKALSSIGIANDSDYDNKIIEHIRLTFPQLNDIRISYVQTVPYYIQANVNKNLGVICQDNSSRVVMFVIVVPPMSADSRTGLIAQQLMPTLTNIIHERNACVGNQVTNKPILVINSNSETYTPSNAINIIGTSNVPGIFYSDLFKRDPYQVLATKNITGSLSSIDGFVNAVNIISNRSSAKFTYHKSQKVLELNQGNLKNPGEGMTNEPYYYLMAVIPAICIASKAGIKIDDTSLRNWWQSYVAQKGNKNIEYFMEWLQKINGQGGKTVQEIYYGSPGTGKSHDIEEYLSSVVTNEDEQVYRTTFHPEYSYSDFVGQIMPSRIYNPATGKYDISYEFYEGVFARALKQAFNDLNQDVYLVVEEMSRGNVAAIFGDLFQLLDRHLVGTKKGWSKYGIRNDRIANQIVQLPNDIITLPPNLHIFGTVNTSDQNVFTMDTAFKRRFQWKYVLTKPAVNPLNLAAVNLSDRYFNNPTISLELGSGSEDVFWTDLYGTLNIFISDSKFLGMGEDKQIGPFFIDFTGMNSNEIKDEVLNKLLNYLWTDIASSRNSRNSPLFSDAVTSYSTLYEKFDNDEQIFSDKFIKAYRDWKNKLL